MLGYVRGCRVTPDSRVGCVAHRSAAKAAGKAPPQGHVGLVDEPPSRRTRRKRKMGMSGFRCVLVCLVWPYLACSARVRLSGRFVSSELATCTTRNLKIAPHANCTDCATSETNSLWNDCYNGGVCCRPFKGGKRESVTLNAKKLPAPRGKQMAAKRRAVLTITSLNQLPDVSSTARMFPSPIAFECTCYYCGV